MDWILALIKKELELKINEGYTGSIDFQVNLYNGGIGNLNIGTKRSVVKPQPK